MHILITGANGQIGRALLKLLLIDRQFEHKIICFDLPKAKKNLNRFLKKNGKDFERKKRIEVVFGDIRNYNHVKALIEKSDIVIHLAFIIPPISDEENAYEVNVVGTENIINSIKNHKPTTKLIFPTSIAEVGFTDNQPIPDSFSHFTPVDTYGLHKKTCHEKILKAKIRTTILRLAVAPPLKGINKNITMFDLIENEPIELIHERDVALAIYNTLFLDDDFFDKKTVLNIGGGKKCQMLYYPFLCKFTKSLGLGIFDKKLLDKKMNAGWLDTQYSQELLEYQQHTIDDILTELKKNNRMILFLVRLLRPIVRTYILRMHFNRRNKQSN